MPANRQTSAHVRELASLYGVSERTVWRWFKRLRASDSTDLAAVLPPLPPGQGRCGACGLPLPADSTIRRRYCDGRCRIAAHRARAARRRHGQLRAQMQEQWRAAAATPPPSAAAAAVPPAPSPPAPPCTLTIAANCVIDGGSSLTAHTASRHSNSARNASTGAKPVRSGRCGHTIPGF